MAISGITDSGASAPVNLTESTDSSAAAPANLTESVSVTSSAPNNLTEKAESSAALPVSGARVSNSGSTAPNNVTEKTVSGASVPSNLAELSDSGAAIPSSLTELSDSGASAPANLAELSDSGAIAPVNLTESTNSGALAPVSLTETVVSAFPRTMTPLVSMDFANNAYSQDNTSVAFDDLFTYARNSNATFWNRRLNKNGKWESFLDTDVVGTVTNLLTYSEQFDHVNWIKVRANITANAAANPVDGSMTVDSLTEDVTASDTHYIRYTNLPHTSGNNYTYYIYIKPNGRSEIQITLGTSAFPTSANAVFNIQAGAVVELGAGASEALITYEGDGWYKCSVSALADATVANGVVDIYLRSGGSGTYNGDGVSGVYLWGAQLTESAKPLPYVKTVSSSASDTFTEALRLEYDPVTFEAKGALIEGGSTNLALRSEDFTTTWTKNNTTVVANAAKAPDGTTSADLVYPATSGSVRTVTQTVTATIATYTTTFIAKAAGFSWIRILNASGAGGAWFNLSTGALGTVIDSATIENLGDGWYECAMTYTGAASNAVACLLADADGSSTATTNGTDGVYLWGAQCEALPFASSYIRTEGSAVARVKDLAVVAAAGNTAMPLHDATVRAIVDFGVLPTGGTGSTRYIFQVNASGDYVLRVRLSGELEYLHGDNTPDIAASNSFGGELDIVGVYTQVDGLARGYLDGVVGQELIAAATAANAYDGAENIYIGNNSAGTENAWFNIKRLDFYEEAMTAQEVSLL